MNETFRPVSCSFEKIKQHLDPAYSYLIFEKSSESSEKAEFRQVLGILKRLDLSIHEWKCFRDEAKKILLLMVRFDPIHTDRILQEFLNLGLPEGVTFYAYGIAMGG